MYIIYTQLNTGQYGNEFQGNDLNVERAWLQGLTGCNVTVTVVDDGMVKQHDKLASIIVRSSNCK